MQYWYIEFEEDQFWIEADEDGTVLRQIISSQTGLIQVSCFEDCLAEGPFNPHEMEGKIDEIADEQFEKQWESQVIAHREKWYHQKLLFSVGKIVIAKVLYHYPQGYIVDIGNALGCVHGVELNCNVGDEIQGLVEDYDEQNMWIIVLKV